jgi:thioredoxin-like negative regulator of GroEL
MQGMGEMQPDSAQQILMAEGFLDLGDAAEALRILDGMPEAGKLQPRAVLLRALLLMSLELWPEAEAVATTGVAAPAASSVMWYSLAVAQAQQQKLEEARVSLQSAFRLDEQLRDVAMRDAALAEVMR